MDRQEIWESGPGESSTSSDLLLLPLPTGPSLREPWDNSEAHTQVEASPESELVDIDLHRPDSQGHDGSDSSDSNGEEHESSCDSPLLTNSVFQDTQNRELHLQMDTLFSESSSRDGSEALNQGESLLDGNSNDPALHRTSSLCARFFDSIALGDLEAIEEHLGTIHQNGWGLTEPLLLEKQTGKTCLMKALLRSQDKSEQHILDVVRILLQHAEEHGELSKLLNASYTDKFYWGQTALHIAIEKGLKDVVYLLVEKGANLRARATGSFFQLKPTKRDHFYFGEYPLSLAACTNQPDLVMFLLNQPDPCLAEARDSQKNTVLHALVLGARDHPAVTTMYSLVLQLSEERRLSEGSSSRTHLEKLRNQQGLTPLQLAAKEGQLELFQHILSREFPMDSPLHHLSRRFLEWTYGPVSCSLYDLSEVDTTEAHSALKMVVSNPDMEKAHELMEVEPLRSLLQTKWSSFAAAMLAISTAWYLLYIGLLTAITVQQPQSQDSDGEPQSRADWMMAGQVYIFLSTSGLLLKTALDIIWMWPFQLLPFLLKNYFHILFFLQALLVLCSLVLSWFQAKTPLVMQGVALVLGWFDLLYYSRGFKLTGIYTVVLQRMILRDVLRFLLVYIVFLLGFASALSTLTSPGLGLDSCPYCSLGNASTALFKLTLGLGDLSGPEHSSHPGFFLVLLITYVILTSVLLLNMLIALMNETVNMVSSRNEKIWRVQRAITTLDLERCLPAAWRWGLLRDKIHTDLMVGKTPSNDRDLRTCLRVNEKRRQTRAAGRNQVMGINEDPIAPSDFKRVEASEAMNWLECFTRNLDD